MKTVKKHAFLAANSCEGFVSHFGDFFKSTDGWRVYIIKGGPGTGKSSFMKKLALSARAKKQSVIECPCSSDPDSLDAVIIENKKTVVLDGTAPHVVEPIYPGAVENIINLGEFYDSDMLYKNRAQIKLLTDRNKIVHGIASAYLSAAGELLEKSVEAQKRAVDFEKTQRYAKTIIKKYFKNGKKQVKPTYRFLSGITPKGFYDFSSELYERCKNRVIISDNIGVVSSCIIGILKEEAGRRGLEATVYKNPFLPSLIYDHIEIPSLNLCVMTENRFIKINSDIRRIHARRFLKPQSGEKNQRSFEKRVFSELILSAVNILKTAKSVHDELESYYISAMDFDNLNVYAQKKIKDIIGS